MPLISLLVYIAVIGLVVWLITTYIPMPEVIRRIIVVVAAVVIILWLLSAVLPLGPGPTIPRLTR